MEVNCHCTVCSRHCLFSLISFSIIFIETHLSHTNIHIHRSAKFDAHSPVLCIYKRIELMWKTKDRKTSLCHSYKLNDPLNFIWNSLLQLTGHILTAAPSVSFSLSMAAQRKDERALVIYGLRYARWEGVYPYRKRQNIFIQTICHFGGFPRFNGF